VARQARPRLIAGAVWALAGGLAAWMLWRQDARIAIGWEIQAGPALLFGIHLLSFAAWELLFLWPLARRARMIPPLAALVGWAMAGDPPERVGAWEKSGPDIVLVTLDTFRGDHVREDLTPNLLALEGRYTQAVTTAPLTAPAHATMLTGMDVPDHGLLANGRVVEVDTVTAHMAEAGYRTGAFLSAQVLDRHTGLDAHFSHYDDRWGPVQRMAWWPLSEPLSKRGHVRRGDETIERALAWLDPEIADFLWVHLYDAHGPYVTPAEFRPTSEQEEAARRLDQAHLKAQQGTLTSLVEMLQSAQPETQKLRYRSAIRYTDHLVGSLLEGLDDDAVVIVVGDHGESLDEHDYYFNHGGRLYEPSLHVPFFVRGMGAWESDQLTSVAEVHRLLLEATGVRTEAVETREVLAYTTGQQAHSKGPQPDGPKKPPRSAALRYDGAKLVLHGDESPAWFDLRLDPEELDPLPVPDELAPEVARLEALIADAPPPLSEEQRLRLQALGYVE